MKSGCCKAWDRHTHRWNLAKQKQPHEVLKTVSFREGPHFQSRDSVRDGPQHFDSLAVSVSVRVGDTPEDQERTGRASA